MYSRSYQQFNRKKDTMTQKLSLHSDFTFVGDNYKLAYRETDDPRLVVLVERDENVTLAQAFDGDALLPVYSRGYRDSGRLTFEGGYEDDEVAEAWTRAYQHRWARDGVEFADRFVRAFYGAEVEHVEGGYRPDFECVVFDTSNFRAHIEDPRGVDRSRESVKSMADEVRNVLDGDVYGIGYAVNAGRVTDETPVAECWDDFDQNIECWGFIGDEYAATAAADFEMGRPELHPLLPAA